MPKKIKADTSIPQFKELFAKHEKMVNDYKRLAADFDNYRKRAEAEKSQAGSAANSGVIMKIFPILDNFRRSAEHAPSITITEEGIPSLNEEDLKKIHSYFEGVRQIEHQLEQILSVYGLRRIETVNQSYDHKTMEAVAYEPHPELPDHTIIEEIEGGYIYGDKVIRPAKVRVSKGSS